MTSLAIVQPVDLAQSVCEAIREAIVAGEIDPGDRLVEVDLANRLGTSRGPVRDAFRRLEETGLVESFPRKGTFVTKIDAQDVNEIYALRTALEQMAIEKIIAKPVKGFRKAVDEVLAKLSAAHDAGDQRAIAEADLRFHRLLIETADNSRLAEAWDRLADQTLLFMSRIPDVAPELQAVAGDHWVIADAVDAGDADTAIKTLRSHLDGGRWALQDLVYVT